VRDYYCEEPYITEEELIRQLICYLPQLKLNEKYLWSQFNDEIKRLTHLKGILNGQGNPIFELTPHKSKVNGQLDLTESENLMLQDYLLHILQFGTPEERIKILAGIQSKFELSQRRLELKR
jgi:hypothetical protein